MMSIPRLRDVAYIPLLTAALLCSGLPAWCSETPSFVFIVVDALRADRLGCYGAERNTSPTIDSLAAAGTRFTRAYSAAPWTQPSVTTMLTGLYPSAHGLKVPGQTIPDSLPILPEILESAGYRTAAVVSHGMLSKKYGFARGFQDYFKSIGRGHRHISTPEVTEKAVEYLHHLSAAREPFFLFVHYFDPHYDYQNHPRIEWASRRAGRLDGSHTIMALRDMLPTMSPRELKYLRDCYDEEIRFTDAGIGRLLEALRRTGREQSTVVIVTADHGEEFRDHGWLGHTKTLYEELIHIPLVIRMPTAPAGLVNELVSLVSLTPTMLDAAGIRTQGRGYHGQSLIPRITTERIVPSDTVFAEVDFLPPTDFVAVKRARKKAIVLPRYKLIRDDDTHAYELFDLAHDSGEHNNLARNRPELLSRLSAVLEDYVTRSARGYFDSGTRELTDREIELLRSLGYVE